MKSISPLLLVYEGKTNRNAAEGRIGKANKNRKLRRICFSINRNNPNIIYYHFATCYGRERKLPRNTSKPNLVRYCLMFNRYEGGVHDYWIREGALAVVSTFHHLFQSKCPKKSFFYASASREVFF